MTQEFSGARKLRKLRASRDGWKERSAEKQQEIKRLRVTVRDLLTSRDHWKSRVQELEQQVHALQQANASRPDVLPAGGFFGG
jgi:predicted  nucleic acid-binding Zn-ribbon protein